MAQPAKTTISEQDKKFIEDQVAQARQKGGFTPENMQGVFSRFTGDHDKNKSASQYLAQQLENIELSQATESVLILDWERVKEEKNKTNFLRNGSTNIARSLFDEHYQRAASQEKTRNCRRFK